jgi:putative spermidine/putrescine transport system ATP-binding protein
VTHDQGEALSMSDRVVVMSAGHVRQIGTPDEIYRRPQDPFVAGFVGDVNILPGRYTGRDGAAMLELGGSVTPASGTRTCHDWRTP